MMRPRDRAIGARGLGARAVWAGALAAALLLSGCSGVNAGSSAEASFTEQFGSDPDVASLDLRSSNDLPWVGSTSGTVVAREGLDETEVRDLTDRVGRYLAAHRDNTGAFGIESDGLSFPVAGDKAANARTLEIVAELRSDERLASADLSGMEFVVTNAGDAFAMAEELPELAERLGLDPDFEFSVFTAYDSAAGSVDGSVELAGAYGDWIMTAAAVHASVAAQVEASRIAAGPESIELRVADERFVPEATELAETAMAGAGIPLTVSSDQLRLDDGADGTAARELLAGLDDETIARIESSEASGRVIRITARTRDDLVPLGEAIDASPDSAAFSTIELRLAGEDGGFARSAGSIDIFAEPGTLASRASAGAGLAGTAGVSSVSMARERLDVSLSEDVAPDDFARFAAALKSAALPGDWVCLFSDTADTLCMTAADTLSTRGSTYEDHPSWTAFVRAWNTAS